MALQRQGRDHLALGVRSGGGAKYGRFHRRSARSDRKCCRFSIGAVTVFLAIGLCVTVLVYCYLSGDDHRVGHDQDLRYWDRDDRRRDDNYGEHILEHGRMDSRNKSADEAHNLRKAQDDNNRSALDDLGHNSRIKGVGLYNEAGRNELKVYEAQYEASLKDAHLSNENENKDNPSDDNNFWKQANADDEYDDSIDSYDVRAENHDGTGNDKEKQSEENRGRRETSELRNGRGTISSVAKDSNKASTSSVQKNTSLSSHNFEFSKKNSQHSGMDVDETIRTPRLDYKRKPRRRKHSGCVMKFLNSTAQLVEPLESRKFARFSLKYTEVEEKPAGEEHWEPRFAGHQNLQERERSFLAQDQKINCGFVRGLKGYPSTGFDLTEDDLNYLSRCHISVSSCIFGNSDRLRAPAGNKITRLSKKNVCFVMFVDEGTLNMLSSEGHMPDRMDFIGLWKIVVVKNLPFTDMRRVGKIPKLLSHRLFPSARYSIWLDSKLRLQLDPLVILEYFLWRKGFEYAISNHYDRHCIWEEVERNKKLNKYNHTAIDEQFNFYLADGLQRFNASDPSKLLPSNVPEGSFIVRAHTPMSNLFSCLWFNEVDRFTPRDQLSFFYTYQKLRRMNPDKPFHLHMFKDCERRAISKLFHHRSDEKRNVKAVG